MKSKNPRNLALQALNRYVHKSSLSHDYLDELFGQNPSLNNRDKAFVNNLVRGVLRWRLRLDWVIKQFADLPIQKMSPMILNILRMALYQILFLDRVPESAAVNEAVNQAKANKKARNKAPFINGILRKVCREKEKIAFPDKETNIVKYLSVYYSYPEWLVNKWIEELGREETENLLSSQNRVLDINIRVNTLKNNRAQLIHQLAEEGIEGKPTSFSPEGIALQNFKGRINELTAFKDGLFQVQDQAAQIAAILLSPEPGHRVLDICAGLGGKSSHLAQIMADQGSIVALDNNLNRLISLGQNAHRLGIGNIASISANASNSLSCLFKHPFDRIIVDAPCSGLGAISRHPDGKWNRDEKDIKRLASLQKAILNEASKVLRRQGRMLYITCTISKQENEEVVKDFLNSHSDMVLEDLKKHVPDWGKVLINDQGFLKTFPHIHHMDGFFGALFTKMS